MRICHAGFGIEGGLELIEVVGSDDPGSLVGSWLNQPFRNQVVQVRLRHDVAEEAWSR